MPTRTLPCKPSPSPRDHGGAPDSTWALQHPSRAPAPRLAPCVAWQTSPAEPRGSASRPPTSAQQACLVSLTSRAPVPGGCHGHGDSAAALGDAPGGSAAGTGVQREDKQGPRDTPSTRGLASGTSDCRRLQRDPLGHKEIFLHSPHAPLKAYLAQSLPIPLPKLSTQLSHGWPAKGRSEVGERLSRQASKKVRRVWVSCKECQEALQAHGALSKVRSLTHSGPTQQLHAGKGLRGQDGHWETREEATAGTGGEGAPGLAPHSRRKLRLAVWG